MAGTNVKFTISADLKDGSINQMKNKIESKLKPEIKLGLNTDVLKQNLKSITDTAFNEIKNLSVNSPLNQLFKIDQEDIKWQLSESLRIYQFNQEEQVRLEKEKNKEIEKLRKEQLQKERRELQQKAYAESKRGSLDDLFARTQTSIDVGRGKIFGAEKIVKTEKIQELKRVTDDAETSLLRLREAADRLDLEFQKDKDVQKYTDGIKELEERTKDLRSVQLSTNREVQNSKITFKDFGKTLWNNMKQFASWTSATSIVMAVIKVVKQMIQTVTELDKAFTNIRMVTGYNREQIQKLKEDYTALAQQLKVATKEVAEAGNEWLRQGLSIEDTTTALTASIKFAKVAAVSTTEATELLTSAMKGYGLTVESLVRISDRLNKVDMASATSAADLAKAMSETAASAKAAGIQMDTLIGYLATMQEVTQDSAESIGNSMKTILARMSSVAAGVDVDEFGESLNDVEKVLIKYGISLRDSYGNMRNMEAVLDEVANKWNVLSNTQRNQIATAIAGTRQAEKFRVLMMNYSRAIDLAKESLESAGTTMNKYGLYMESVEAATNGVTAAFEKLSTSVIDASSISAILDVLASLMEIINVIEDNIHIFEDISLIIKQITDALKITIDMVVGILSIPKIIADSIDNSGVAGKIINNLVNPFEMLRTIIEGITIAFDWLADGITHLFGGKTQQEIEETKNKVNELGDAYNQFVELASQSELSEVQSVTLKKLQDDMAETSASYRKMLKEGKDATYAYYMANLEMREQYLKSIGQETYLDKEGVKEALAELDSFYNKWGKMDTLTQKNNMNLFQSYIDKVKNASRDENYQEWVKDMIGDYEDAYRAAVEYDPIDYEISQIKKKAQEQKAAWEEEKASLEKKKELEDKILAVQEAQEKLAQAQNKRARVYRAGRGFVYEQDFSVVSQAQKTLNEAKSALEEYQRDTYYDTLIENLESLQSAEQSLWRDSTKGLQDWYNESEKKYEMNVENYEGMIEKIRDITKKANIDLNNTALGNILANTVSSPYSSEVTTGSTDVGGSYIQTPKYTPTYYGNSGGVTTINISNLSLPGVTNAENFMEDLQRFSYQMGASHK